MDRQWRRRREQEEGEKEVKMRRGHPRLLPGRGREEGWQVVEKESRGCKGYPEGANCSGVRLGCCQDTSCQHTPGARHTHTETHTHTLRPGPKCVNNPANFTPPPNHHHPTHPQPLKTQSGINLQRQLRCQAHPAAGPAPVYSTALETHGLT